MLFVGGPPQRTLCGVVPEGTCMDDLAELQHYRRYPARPPWWLTTASVRLTEAVLSDERPRANMMTDE